MEVSQTTVYRLGDVMVDRDKMCVVRAGRPESMRNQAFQALLYLLEHRQRAVSREELSRHIWGETAVTPDALVQCIVEIRKVLGDDPRSPRWIKTIPKLGYRFIGDVGGEDTIPKPAAVSRRAPGWLALAAAAIGVGILWMLSSRGGFNIESSHPEGKRPVVVFHFNNVSGNRDLDWLREGLADMLITNLSRSSKLNIVSRQQLDLLSSRAGRAPGSTDSRAVLDIARRAKAEAIVLGGFVRLGEKTRLDAQLLDARTGQLLGAESVTANSDSEVFAQVDLLTLKLAVHLGVPINGIRVSDVTTANLEAYRYYSLAVEKAAALQNTEALSLLQKAVALDPEFAMAHARIGYILGVIAGAPDGQPAIEKALLLGHRLTDKDRLYVTAWSAISRTQFVDAIAPLQRIIDSNPLEIEAYVSLGKILRGELRFEEAIQVCRRGLAMDPESPFLYNVLGATYSAQNRHREAIQSHRRYVDLAPADPNAYDSLALSLQWAGEYGESLETYQRALRFKPDFEIAVIHLGNLYFQTGRYREATRQYERYIQVAKFDLERQRGIVYIAMIQRARRRLEEMEAIISQQPVSRVVRVWLELALGRSVTQEHTDRALAELPAGGRGARGAQREEFVTRARVAMRNGNGEQALSFYRRALQSMPGFGEMTRDEDCLAQGLMELGRWDESIAEYVRVLGTNPRYPLAHFHLAQAYERKGARQEARVNYAKFLEVWKDADRDVPEVMDADRKLR